MIAKTTLVQFGCGRSCPHNWINYDASPRLRIEKMPVFGWMLGRAGWTVFPQGVKTGDIAVGLPHDPNSVDAVYCSHVLEHLNRSCVRVAIRNTYEMLRPGGVFRLVVPDLGWRVEEYMNLRKTDPEKAADTLLTQTRLGRPLPERGLVARLRAVFGNSAHLWMYDYDLMAKLLKDAGFQQVRTCEFGDSHIAAFSDVEEIDRFLDGGHKELAIEAVKIC